MDTQKKQRKGGAEKAIASGIGALIAISGTIAAVSNIETAALGIFVALLGFGVLIYAQFSGRMDR
ncbi:MULTISPECIES: hypothetical protein [unclassified Pseudactinotalea]|uniref:hypothetical protein n=1 Tax=Micrococcales TaxID=85006 RepID=UPI003C7A9448